MNNNAIIRFVDVVKTFGSQTVLDRVSLEFPEGKTTVIAGGSGQGKSVTLKLILGLLKADSGAIYVGERDITRMVGSDLNQIRTDFGVLFQGAALLDSLTVYENIALPLEERTKKTTAEIRDRVFDKLKQFDLEGHEEKYPAQLSGGMRKRVGLARALMLHPKIMLFDEPTTGLDPVKTMEIYQLFHRTQLQYGYTSIIVSHDIPKIFNLADRVAILNNGRFECFNSPDEIQAADIPEIREFVGSTMGRVYFSREVE
jgi:phospholipid/cholesterol/gamma-HCH transport system ATP-binding protein